MTTQRLRSRDVGRQRGQAMIEYLLLITFIGFGSVAVVPRFALDIANAFGALANDVAVVFPGSASGGTSGGTGSQGGAAAAGPTGGSAGNGNGNGNGGNGNNGNGNNGQNNGQGSGGQDNGFGSPNK